jgi:hypothetical protein
VGFVQSTEEYGELTLGGQDDVKLDWEMARDVWIWHRLAPSVFGILLYIC